MKGFENVPPHGKRERGSEKKPEEPRQPIPEVAGTISSKEQPPRNMTPTQNISSSFDHEPYTETDKWTVEKWGERMRENYDFLSNVEQKAKLVAGLGAVFTAGAFIFTGFSPLMFLSAGVTLLVSGAYLVSIYQKRSLLRGYRDGRRGFRWDPPMRSWVFRIIRNTSRIPQAKIRRIKEK